MHTAAFWAIIATVSCLGMLTTAVAFHQVSLLGEHGLSATEAAAPALVAVIVVLVRPPNIPPGAVESTDGTQAFRDRATGGAPH